MLADPRQREFATLCEIARFHGEHRPDHRALVGDDQTFTYRELTQFMNQFGAALRRDGLKKGDRVAICCERTSALYGAIFLGIIGIGGVAVPLAPSSTAQALSMQIADSGAKFLFRDAAIAQLLAGAQVPALLPQITIGETLETAFEEWLGDAASFALPDIAPEDGFNLIYSSGTTGIPKGILQPHSMRWSQINRATYPAEARTMISTPLYSNTTLVSFLPTIAGGGTAILLPKFDAQRFLEVAERERATHAMLVPVQYARLLADPRFDAFDLSSFQMKFSTSAPLSPALKREILDRWPGGLVEFYGMTEGGGTCMLMCHAFPDKLHTVGSPLPGHDIRLIDEEGREVPIGETGEVVGRSGAMMKGYHNRPDATSAIAWVSAEGEQFIRTGDVGRFDEDGFLTLLDRKKDVIISGGFNIYPSDIEHHLLSHHNVIDAAVVGVPSPEWGETPVAFVVLREGGAKTVAELTKWLNARVSKLQRVRDIVTVDELPRSTIGKVLKRQLRDDHAGRGSH
jgi:acyl-CoA synthetase (AMP-forming)/AMP-acid ligase II